MFHAVYKLKYLKHSLGEAGLQRGERGRVAGNHILPHGKDSVKILLNGGCQTKVKYKSLQML